MHCPSLIELPPPPEGKTGWPWTVETPPLPPARPDGSPWPRISIVTPSYNQGQFLEETIRSVLLQGYPDLEYIVIDGGSTDGAEHIIQKYAKWLTYWHSGPDAGQASAINIGIAKCSGEWLNWLNSDDMLAENALAKIAGLCALRPDADLISGSRLICREIGSGWAVDPVWQNSWRDYLIDSGVFPQEASFYSARAAQIAGPLMEDSNYQFDVIHFLKILRAARRIVVTNEILTLMHVHARQKTRERNRPPSREDAELMRLARQRSLLKRFVGRASRTRYSTLVLEVFRNCPIIQGRPIEQIDYDWTTGDFFCRKLSGRQ